MIKQYVKARWLFVLGLLIFALDFYIVFQPSTSVQADATFQPTANDLSSVESSVSQPQPPPTTVSVDVNPTAELAQSTDVPSNTDAPSNAVSTPDGATSEPVQVTDDSVTREASTDLPTDDAAVVATETPQEPLPTAEATTEASGEFTQEPSATTETTAELIATDMPAAVNTDVPVEATSEVTAEATAPVEAVNDAEAFALQAVPLATEPDVELGVTCPSQGVASFTLRNNGGDMPAPGHYSVSNPASSNTFQLAAGQSITFQAAGDATVSADYTTTAGAQVTLSATGQCTVGPTFTPTSTATRRPTLTPSNTPTPSMTFTPSNTPTITQTPTITRTPTQTFTPTITLTPTNTFTPTITLTPSITPTPSMTFTPTNTLTPSLTFTPSNTPTPTLTLTPSNTPEGTFTPTPTRTPTATATLQPGTPLIELSVACLPVAPNTAPQARFRMRNVGGDMLDPGTYTLTEPGKVPQNNSFLLAAGQVQDLIAAGDAKVDVAYSSIVFSNVTLGVTGTCLNTPTLTPSATFTPLPVVNTPAPVQPTDVPPTDVPPQSTATRTPRPTSTAVISSNSSLVTGGGSNGGSTGTQGQSQNATSVNPELACGSADTTLNNSFPVIDMANPICNPQPTTIERPAWTPVSVGGAVCQDWMIYHTDMTGDWEIFRLGNLPDNVQADPNISRGIGRNVYDIMPSRSPDQMWIAFATNRDTNWEIYISEVDKDNIRRLTYTPDAVELDPVWSPVGGNIIYESNRDGNWNLYMFNVQNGTEKRLTDGQGNEINAAWSPDGKQIVFQSDQEGFWQIYEMNIATLATQLLSDGIGDDHGAQFSHDGKQIVFHSLREGFNSVIFTMNADGSGVTSISDPAGNAINHAWSPDDRFIAYQSNVDGDEDVYVYELSTKLTRKLTDNGINDYAPTWYCDAPVVAFTSDITGDSNIFAASVLPIRSQPLDVEKSTNQLTFDAASDQYPVDSPSEENASRQDTLPSPVKNK